MFFPGNLARDNFRSGAARSNIPSMSNENKTLKTAGEVSKLYESLGEEARRSLCDYIDFLTDRYEPVVVEIPEPDDIPRPENETVVGAIKRLKAKYHMIESMAVFSRASSLMTQHMMNGRDANEVIDEMEDIFEQAYRDLLSNNE
jgi:hypothetical protein